MSRPALASTAGDDLIPVVVGDMFAHQKSPLPVSRAEIARFTEAYEMASAEFHDADRARLLGFPDIVAPVSMLMPLLVPPYWTPGGPPMRDGAMPGFAWTRIDLPGNEMMATDVGFEFYRDLVRGMRLGARYTVVGVTPKRTRVGDGAFVDVRIDISDEADVPVATMSLTAFRYTPAPAEAAGPRSANAGSDSSQNPPSRTPVGSWTAGMCLPDVPINLTLQRLVMMSTANKDFAPTHVDDAAARASGAPAAYADMISIFAFFELCIRHHAGDGARIRRLDDIRLRDFTVHGQPLVVEATVEANEVADDGLDLWVVRLQLRQGGRLTATGTVVVRPPTVQL